MLLLEQDIIRKKQMNKLPEPEKFKAKDIKDYKIKIIIDSIVYDKKTND